MDTLVATARENAALRAEILRRGLASAAILEERGYVSHDELELWERAGVLDEGLEGLARRWDELLHPRNRVGRWRGKEGSTPTTPRISKVRAVSNQRARVKVTEPGPHGPPDVIKRIKARGARGKTYNVFATPGPGSGADMPAGRQGLPERMSIGQWREEMTPHKELEKAGQKRIMRLERQARREGVRATRQGDHHLARQKHHEAEQLAAAARDAAALHSHGAAELYGERTRRLERRIKRDVRRHAGERVTPAAGAVTRGPHDLSAAEVHFNDAGKVSQRTLLAYAEEAASRPTTVEMYRNAKGEYHPSRAALHADIVDMFLRARDEDGSLSRSNEHLAPPSGAPTVAFTGGGYASGKAGVVKMLKRENRWPEDAVLIDPDEVKAALPEFQLEAGTDPEANLRCHDALTETLTEDGWLTLPELVRRHEQGPLQVATFTDGRLQYEPMQDLFLASHRGRMLHFKHQSMDLMVTAEHRMVVKRTRTGRWHVVRAGELDYQDDGRSNWHMPVVAASAAPRVETFTLPAVAKYPAKRTAHKRNHVARGRHMRIEAALAAGELQRTVAKREGCSVGLVESVAMGRHKRRSRPRAMWPERQIPMDAWLDWLGWWLAEGDANGALYQSEHSPFLRDLAEAVEAAEIPCSVSWPNGKGRWLPTGWARQLKAWLAEHAGVGAHGKRVPDFVFKLPPEQALILLRSAIHGDGTTRGKHWDGSRSVTYNTVSRTLADDIQRLAVHCGLKASVRRYRNAVCWNVQISRPKMDCRRIPRPTSVEYDGTVFCIQTPSRTMITRRNGYVGFTGNSYSESWDISQEIAAAARDKGLNVVVDGITNTSAEEVAARVKSFTDAGYEHPSIHYVTVPTEEALSRARARAEQAIAEGDVASQRMIPEVIMRAVHRDASATIPGVLSRAAEMGADVEVYDTDQGKDPVTNQFRLPKLIASADAAGHIAHQDDEAWGRLLSKATEKIPVGHGKHLGDTGEPRGVWHHAGAVTAVNARAERDVGAAIDEALPDVHGQNLPGIRDPSMALTAAKIHGLPAMEKLLDLGGGVAAALGARVNDVSADQPFGAAKADVQDHMDVPHVIIAPTKGLRRTLQKLNADRTPNDATHLQDVLRATVTVPSADRLPEAASVLVKQLQDDGWEIERVKNRLADADGSRRMGGGNGYGDVTLYARVPPEVRAQMADQGLVAEFQINTNPLWWAKEVGPGHDFYAEARQVQGLSMADGRAPTEAEAAVIQAAEDAAAQVYSNAWGVALNGGATGDIEQVVMGDATQRKQMLARLKEIRRQVAAIKAGEAKTYAIERGLGGQGGIKDVKVGGKVVGHLASRTSGYEAQGLDRQRLPGSPIYPTADAAARALAGT